MENKHTRRGFTQIKRVGQALLDNALAKGHLAAFIPPHPASGHPLPQGARKTTHGFTLIELLVVVLIIGILAAIALPQYKKAVAKARVATTLPVLQNMRQAQESYYMANGNYSEDMTKLDVEWPSDCTFEEGGQDAGPCGPYFYFSIKSGFATENYAATVIYCPNYNTHWNTCNTNRDFTITYRYAHAKELPNERFCLVNNSSTLGESVCKSLSGKSSPDIGTAYLF